MEDAQAFPQGRSETPQSHEWAHKEDCWPSLCHLKEDLTLIRTGMSVDEIQGKTGMGWDDEMR